MRDRDFPDAQAIAKFVLDELAIAFHMHDFDAFSRRIALPQRMYTGNGFVLVESTSDLRQIFDRGLKAYRDIGVTRIERVVVAAEFRDPDRVESTHESLLYNDNDLVQDPFPGFHRLERQDGVWRVVSSEYAVDEASPTARALHGADVDRDRVCDPGAKAIYQEHLDALSDALLTGDFEAFSARISLPHRMTTQSDDMVISDDAHCAQVFRTISAAYRRKGLTALVRIVMTARFDTEDVILGTHITHQMQAQTRVTPPYPNRVRLARGADGRWRETHCANAVLNTSLNWTLGTRVADTPELPDLNLSSERTTR